MNVDHLKTEWAKYNAKLSQTKQLGEQLITSMLRERSRSRISGIRRANTFYLLLMCLVFGLLIAIFAGNPFDFRYQWQYAPYGLLLLGVSVTIGSLVQSLLAVPENLSN